MSIDIVSTKIYDKFVNFDFEIVNLPVLDGDVPRSTSYGVYISQQIWFTRAASHVADSNIRNKLLTQKLLKERHRYHKLWFDIKIPCWTLISLAPRTFGTRVLWRLSI